MSEALSYPLEISFKLIALAPQLSVTDAQGRLAFYVQQKLFKLKEAVTVFADREKTEPLVEIKADKILDISACYNFTDPTGAALGAVQRRGMKSIWRAHYDILDAGNIVMNIGEENPWAKLFDGILQGIPVIGMFSGYFFHPSYAVSRADDQVVMRVTKQPAFFEGKFKVEKLAELDQLEEVRILMSLMMMLLLERRRG